MLYNGNINTKTGYDYVLIGRTATYDIPYEQLCKDLRWCLKRLGGLDVWRLHRHCEEAMPTKQSSDALAAFGLLRYARR